MQCHARTCDCIDFGQCGSRRGETRQTSTLSPFSALGQRKTDPPPRGSTTMTGKVRLFGSRVKHPRGFWAQNATKPRCPEGKRGSEPTKVGKMGSQSGRERHYLSSTVAPASTSLAFAFSASSLLAFSRTGFGALSTRSFASFQPRLVISRTALMT